jgi:hypothetical protein
VIRVTLRARFCYIVCASLSEAQIYDFLSERLRRRRPASRAKAGTVLAGALWIDKKSKQTK